MKRLFWGIAILFLVSCVNDNEFETNSVEPLSYEITQFEAKLELQTLLREIDSQTTRMGEMRNRKIKNCFTVAINNKSTRNRESGIRK